jgi:hypothetical protein
MNLFCKGGNSLLISVRGNIEVGNTGIGEAYRTRRGRELITMIYKDKGEPAVERRWKE